MQATWLACAQNKAQREGRSIVFIDESGLSERPSVARTWKKDTIEDLKEQVEMLLSRGVVPQVLMDQARVKVERAKAAVDSQLLTAVIQGYVNNAPVAPSEADLLAAMQGELRGVTIADVDYEWAESYVRKLKVDRGDVR
ncbi:hypothetical protein [Verminephrobacter eiseniae]|uniref:hypothetical protein n=1 Tax=Verminephrobacter eiseniae TaxID=364317 RepID=UPI002238A141|nr:hypothetical protein [Verminephrobacter eiseniae]MCW5236613.1 hypothetical protein [Verminephrobacter eiseniae]